MIFTDSYSTVRSITNVGIDDYAGGELAARHFLENGHRNLAFYGPEVLDNGVVTHRMRGVRHSSERSGDLSSTGEFHGSRCEGSGLGSETPL